MQRTLESRAFDPRKIHSAGRTRARHRRHRRDSTGAGEPCPVRSKEGAEWPSAVVIRDLLKAALRHRPDRIVLGEIRGGEAFDLLQLLNTGHSGTLSTIHANSAGQGLVRFTSCVLQSGVDLPYRAVKTNIADSLNVVIHVERRPGRRYISEVLFINRYEPDADLFDYGAVYLAKQDHP